MPKKDTKDGYILEGALLLISLQILTCSIRVNFLCLISDLAIFSFHILVTHKTIISRMKHHSFGELWGRDNLFRKGDTDQCLKRMYLKVKLSSVLITQDMTLSKTGILISMSQRCMS